MIEPKVEKKGSSGQKQTLKVKSNLDCLLITKTF